MLSYLLLAGLLVGVPVWLVMSAGTPGVHLDVGALWHATAHRRPGDAREVARWLGQVALLLAWIAWAWLTVCVLVEVWAWRTGRSPVRLPASRSVQRAAALLVGTAFAVGALGRLPLHTVGGAGSARAAAPVEAEWSGPAMIGTATPRDGLFRYEDQVEDRPLAVDDGKPAVGGAMAGDTLPAHGSLRAPAGGPIVVVHAVAERETLWSVAEDRLGAARRWREIAELNYGILQPDGGSLDQSHWVLPGWMLRLPPSDPAISHGPTDTVRHLPDSDRRSVPDHATASSQRAMTIGPSAPVAVPGGRGGSAADPSAASATGEAPTEASGPDDPGGGLRGVPVMPLGAGIVGVGVADLVDRLRRVQQRHRAAGSLIRMPGPTLRPFEQRLRVGDGAGDLDDVEAAVRLLAKGSDWPGTGRLVGVRLDGDRVHLTFDELSDEVPSPLFTRETDGRSLSVDREVVRRTAGRRKSERQWFVAPTLVSVGRNGGELVMLAVEGLGSVVIGGDPPAAEGLGRAMALELATSRWAAAFDLVLVGFGGAMAHGDRVSVLAEAGPLIADLSWRRLTTGIRIAEREVASVDGARLLGVVGEWAPVVIVCGPAVPEDDVDAILDLAGDGRFGISVVAMAGLRALSGEPGCFLRAQPSPDQASTDVFGTVVTAQSVDEHDLDEVAAVIEAALVRDADPGPGDGGSSAPDGPSARAHVDVRRDRVTGFVPGGSGSVARADVDSPIGARDRPRDAIGVGTRTPADPGTGRVWRDRSGIEVEVAVLGPVAIHGAARGFTRAWALELVVYLAMHPAGAANEVWATALWPDRLMAPSSLHSTASVARRSLGTDRNGSDHLPKAHGRLALASTVGSDWQRFRELAAVDDPERWQEALEIVRGRPFDGIRATDWALLDGTSPAIEAAVVDLAGRLAGARLRSGDATAAEWAARKGLLVSPYDERLYRMLLRTADAAGNPSGVESVMEELVRVVADEVEPVESVHPSTLALYRSLSRRTSTVLNGSHRSGPV